MAKKKKWIQAADIKEGAFTAKAKKAGMSVAQYARKVLSPNSNADEKTKRQARLALTFIKMSKKKKK